MRVPRGFVNHSFQEGRGGGGQRRLGGAGRAGGTAVHGDCGAPRRCAEGGRGGAERTAGGWQPAPVLGAPAGPADA